MVSKKKTLTNEEEQFLRNIGFRIGYFRKMRGLSQQSLADIVGISLNSISHIEGQAITGISLITLHRISIALSVDISQLFDFE